MEGGYVNHPADPGGATNQGITQRVYDAWRAKSELPTRSVRDIDPFEVKEIYRLQYWQPSGANVQVWPMSLAVFDAAVNHGVKRARQFLVEAPTFDSYLARRERFYHAIVAHRPESKVFLKGWMNRLKHLREAAA
jgi:lysozyme family protein